MDDITHDSASGNVCEDDASQSGDDAADNVHVTLSPYKDGAYDNPVTDTMDPDNTDVHSRTESKDSTTSSKRLVRQHCTIAKYIFSSFFAKKWT